MRRIAPFVILTMVFVVSLPSPGQAGPWFRAAGGLSDMAMEDINGRAFDFYNDPASTATFGTVNPSFVLDLGFGSDVSPLWGIGFHWDRQWAGTSATSFDVDGDLSLSANFFMGRGYWRPLRNPKWNLGLVGGMGYFFTDGKTEVNRGSTNYGQGEVQGNDWAFDAAVLLGWAIASKTELQVQGGWRWATIDDLRVDSTPILNEDGSATKLDYSGWQFKVGVCWLFDGGDDDGEGIH